MSQKQISIAIGTLDAPSSVSEWKRFQRVFFQRKLVKFGAGILAILAITAIFAPLLTPHDPYRGNLSDSLVQPNAKYLLGTDIQGRDMEAQDTSGCI